MNCVECNKEFIQFVSGHNLYCSDCHSVIIESLNPIQTKKSNLKNIPKPTIVLNKFPMTDKQLIESEKYYHSIHWHNKNMK